MTALATRPDHRLAVGEQFDPAIVRSYPTDRQLRIAAASRVRVAVPERAEQLEVMAALFGCGEAWRRRADNAKKRARAKAVPAPVKPAVRKPPPASPMVPIGLARVHVADLIAQGMRQQAIARAAGVSEAAVSMLVRGAYKKGDALRQEITADLQKRILGVEFEAPPVRQRKPKCRSAAEFKAAGERVGQCLACGEVAPLCRGRLTAHVTRQALGGAS